MDYIDRTLKDGSNIVYAWFEAMHTRIDVILWDMTVSVADLHLSCEDIAAEVGRIERMASCFLDDSEVTAINASPAGVPVMISEEMFDILERCVSYNRSTGGLFDIAVSSELAGTSLEDKVRLDRDSLSAVRLSEYVRLNLSGFLKGYALDRSVKIISGNGLGNALVSFGSSSICALGNHPGGQGWPVATLEGEEFVLKDECLTTSGNSSDDRRHIINPATGRYVEGKSAVSVRTSGAEEGEVISTTTFLKSNINN